MKKMLAVLFILTIAACSLASNQAAPPLPGATQPLPPTLTASPTLIPPTASPTPPPPTATLIPSPTATPLAASHPWWDDTVFYEIYVRSFYDSNGDGIGDINGLIEKLDYLNDGNPGTTSDLGIPGIWLMPIHPSPSLHGYDVTDFYGVNPQYGTLDDFRRLVDEAHRRGIRVVKVWAVAHVIANGTVAGTILFNAFLLWAVLDYIAARTRDRRQSLSYPAKGVSRDVIVVAIGLVAWFVFAKYLHAPLIGVAPFG